MFMRDRCHHSTRNFHQANQRVHAGPVRVVVDPFGRALSPRASTDLRRLTAGPPGLRPSSHLGDAVRRQVWFAARRYSRWRLEESLMAALDYDVIVVGSGFGGSVAAMLRDREGLPRRRHGGRAAVPGVRHPEDELAFQEVRLAARVGAVRHAASRDIFRRHSCNLRRARSEQVVLRFNAVEGGAVLESARNCSS